MLHHRARHALHHVASEPTVMALAYGAATPLAHGPTGLVLITAGYLTVVALGIHGEHAAEHARANEPCTGRHAVCRYVA
jgi:hypothetical protein